jgi:hypothetical protein
MFFVVLTNQHWERWVLSTAVNSLYRVGRKAISGHRLKKHQRLFPPPRAGFRRGRRNRTAEDINREIGMLLCCVTHRLGDFLYCYLSLVLYFIFIPSSFLPPSHFRFMYLCERVFKILNKNRILTRHSVKTDGPIVCEIGRSWVHVTTHILAGPGVA